MTDKKFKLRNPSIDNDIHCEEISYNDKWVTYGEICDLLNEQEETIHLLKKDIEIIEEELENERKAYNKCHKDRTDLFIRERDTKNELREYRQKVKETLQKHYEKVDTIGKYVIKDITKELGVELK